MKDQVDSLTERSISAGYLDSNPPHEIEEKVSSGQYSILYISPELLLSKWRGLFASPVYQRWLVELIVDEAHCVVKW